MRTSISVGLCALATILATPVVYADDTLDSAHALEDSYFDVNLEKHSESHPDEPVSKADSRIRTIDDPLCALAADQPGAPACIDDVACDSGTQKRFTLTLVDDRLDGIDSYCAGQTPTAEDLAAAEFFRYKPTVTAPIIDPSGTTLCNYPTNFVSETGPVDEIRVLLGRNVILRVTPIEWRWDYGDNTTETRKIPGKPLNHALIKSPKDIEGPGYITHKYATKSNDTNISVQVRYRGEYSIDGNAFKPIQGTITATSPITTLIIKETRAELVDPNAPMPSSN